MAPSYNVGVLTEMIQTEVTRRGRGAQTRLAEAVKVEVQTVNKWFKGQTHPDPARWAAIEQHFEWPAGEIAMRVMPNLADAPAAALLTDLARQVENLADRVARLERARND